MKATIIVLDSKLITLLRSANKWVRWVEERTPKSQLRHGADPTPLRKKIDATLKLADRAPRKMPVW